MKDHHFHAGCLGGFDELPVVGILVAIPVDSLHRLERSRVSIEDGHARFFQIMFDFGFECVEVRFHFGHCLTRSVITRVSLSAVGQASWLVPYKSKTCANAAESRSGAESARITAM